MPLPHGMNGKLILKIIMQTIQNKIWTYYLLLGVFSLSILGFSCKKAHLQIAQFYYVNDTDYTIRLINQSKKHIFLPRQTTIINQDQAGDGKVNTDDFKDPFTNDINIEGKELIFQLEDKCLTHTVNSEHSIINLKNYVAERVNKITYKFTYTFTEADYNRAVACP